MQKVANWRHMVAAAVVIVAVLVAGWKLFMGPPPPPNVPAPAGANPRMEDVPEFAPAANSPSAGRSVGPVGLPEKKN